MKIWTYLEQKTKVLNDIVLTDETSIGEDEIAGYFNEALAEAESEIMELNEEYFKTKYFVPLVTGTGVYNFPDNIYANKIRGIIYKNGSIIYPVVKYRRRYKFQNIALSDQYGTADDYRYDLINDYPGQAQFELHPVSRESAILPPSASYFTPMIMHYIRNCARVPITGEYCNPEIINPTNVNATTNVITVNAGTANIGIAPQGVIGGYPGSIAYITGDKVKFKAGPGGTLPAPLVAGTVYYVILLTATTIKLATSRVNALAGTAIDITTAGTVFHVMSVAATQNIMDATLIDIPEFATFVMQWVKCRCIEKLDAGDPTLVSAAALLVQQKQQMVDTLKTAVPDDDDEIQPDFSSYEEMS